MLSTYSLFHFFLHLLHLSVPPPNNSAIIAFLRSKAKTSWITTTSPHLPYICYAAIWTPNTSQTTTNKLEIFIFLPRALKRSQTSETPSLRGLWSTDRTFPWIFIDLFICCLDYLLLLYIHWQNFVWYYHSFVAAPELQLEPPKKRRGNKCVFWFVLYSFVFVMHKARIQI